MQREYVCINNLHLNALVLVSEIDRCNTLGLHDSRDPRWILQRSDNPDPIVGRRRSSQELLSSRVDPSLRTKVSHENLNDLVMSPTDRFIREEIRLLSTLYSITP